MALDGLELIKPTMLYNMLQQATIYSRLSDPNYLLLIDARNQDEYNESHVITAKRAQKSEYGTFMIPYDAELECKQNIVIYDSKTQVIEDINAPALDCGLLFWNSGSRNTVKILRGGYEEFSALYPFLRTQKIIFMPQELDEIKPYPVEIIKGFLYLGNWTQGNAPYVQKDLKIKAHINVCVEAETFFSGPGPEVLHIQVEDMNEADLFSYFPKVFTFIEKCLATNSTLLVFDKQAISRGATVVLAYIMKKRRWQLQKAYSYVKNCLSTLRPNRGFIEQLSRWEESIFEARITDIDDPAF